MEVSVPLPQPAQRVKSLQHGLCIVSKRIQGETSWLQMALTAVSIPEIS